MNACSARPYRQTARHPYAARLRIGAGIGIGAIRRRIRPPGHPHSGLRRRPAAPCSRPGAQSARRNLNWLPINDTPPLAPQTSVHYADARVKQPRPPAKLSSALHRLPPPHRPARDGHRGGKTARFRVDPTGQPCPPITIRVTPPSGNTFRANQTGSRNTA